MRLSNEQLVFLARFARSPEGNQLLTILKAKLGDRESKLRTTVGEEVYRTQGRALELDELIADITEAQQRLTRVESAVTSRNRSSA
jgi:hypothetical protein